MRTALITTIIIALAIIGVASYASAMEPINTGDGTMRLDVGEFDPNATRVDGKDIQPAIDQFLLEAQEADENAQLKVNRFIQGTDKV